MTITYEVASTMTHVLYCKAIIRKTTRTAYNIVTSVKTVVGNHVFDPKTGKMTKILPPQTEALLTSKTSPYALQMALTAGNP